ncbi:hypothetical protein TNCV_911281 [Trichonephila clavipes]|nr:hypothetical protein TNCV_911281 [Trichonephila clavipes]
MENNMLNTLMLLRTQNGITMEIDYNDVINDFAMIEARRKPFCYTTTMTVTLQRIRTFKRVKDSKLISDEKMIINTLKTVYTIMYMSGVTYIPGRILGAPKVMVLQPFVRSDLGPKGYGFATLYKIRLGTQNLTLQEVANVLRNASDEVA